MTDLVRYKATTPAMDADGNRIYNEKTLGVRFDNGIAFFDSVTIDKHLGLSAEAIALRMVNDFGYEVEILDQSGVVIGKVERTEIPKEWAERQDIYAEPDVKLEDILPVSKSKNEEVKTKRT